VCKVLAKTTAKIIRSLDKQPYVPRLVPAGQVVCFHPGEQPHAGVGYNGEVDTVLPEFKGRIVAYFFLLPKQIPKHVEHLAIFQTEFPWGLMADGVRWQQVYRRTCLLFSKFLFY
jgi:hypothetical protein